MRRESLETETKAQLTQNTLASDTSPQASCQLTAPAQVDPGETKRTSVTYRISTNDKAFWKSTSTTEARDT